MDDIEVIEMGEDGSFDIPSFTCTSTKLNPPQSTVSDDFSTVNKDNFPFNELSLNECIAPGEFKMFVKRKMLYVAIRLVSSEELMTCKIVNNDVLITTNESKTYKILISVDFKMKPESAVCKTWEKFVVVSIELN